MARSMRRRRSRSASDSREASRSRLLADAAEEEEEEEEEEGRAAFPSYAALTASHVAEEGRPRREQWPRRAASRAAAPACPAWQ